MQEIGATGLLEGTGGGGGGGTVDSVVAGAGISVDNTDPANPIVTNTATGGSPAGADTEIQYNDAGAFGASSDFVFNDTTKVFQVKHGGDNLLLVSAAAGDYGLGDLDGIGNNTRFFIDDTIKVASIAAGGDRIRLNIDGTAFTGKIGDIDGIGNDTVLTVDDSTLVQRITLSANDPGNSSASLYVSPFGTQFSNTATTGDSVVYSATSSSGQLQGTDGITGNVGSVNISGGACSIEYFDVTSFEQTKLQATPAAAIMSYYDGTTITNGLIVNTTNLRVGNYDASGNSTLITINDTNRIINSTGTELIGGAINSTNAPTSDPISYSGTFTGVVTTTYTITVAGSGVDFDWTDGTNSGTNVPMDFGNPVLLSNGISITFDGFAYTPTEYWTFAFTATSSQRLTLDYANKVYGVGNTASSGNRARFITDGTTNARIGTYRTGYTAELRTTSNEVGFVYDNGTYSSALSASNSQIYQAITNISTGATGFVDVRTNFLQIYLQEGGTGYNDGIFIDNGGEIKIGNFDTGRNGTFITVDDSIERIRVNRPFGLQGYTVATLPTGYAGAMAYVTDALAPAFGATVVGGGAVVMKVWYNGTNWIVG